MGNNMMFANAKRIFVTSVAGTSTFALKGMVTVLERTYENAKVICSPGPDFYGALEESDGVVVVTNKGFFVPMGIYAEFFSEPVVKDIVSKENNAHSGTYL